MKKIITTLLIGPIIAVAGFLAYRHQNNVSSVVPYPYVIDSSGYKELTTDAPILIIGDRLGERLGSFADIMAKKASQNLSKPIRVESIARKGEGLHRTLAKIKSLKRLPLIIIYLGGSEENHEEKFKTRDIATISSNMDLYENEKIQTLLMIFPALSRFVFTPVDYVRLKRDAVEDKNDYGPMTTLKRNTISFKLYEQEINELFSYARDRSSYMIAISTPLNLDVRPKLTCPGSLPKELEPKLQKARELLSKKDYKQAYGISKEVSLIANASAEALYIHGQAAKKLGKIAEAQEYLELAIAYDCANWRGSPVYNEILRKAAESHDVAFFDLNRLLKNHWTKNTIFFDEIYPQNLYMEKAADAIAAKIKKLLKL